MNGPAKILAVDDEPDFELLLKQRFRQRIRKGELAFRFARHGEEALAVLAEEPDIGLLLLDINMPVMDGLTLLSELRSRRSPARAVIVSAYGDMANIRTAMNRGAFDFVTKPVDLNDLEVTIDKTLETIAEIRALDQQRAEAERARTNLARYFSPNLVDLLAEQRRAAGAGAAPDGGRAVRRHRRLHPHGRDHAARSGRRHAARVPRAHGRRRSSPAAARSRNTSATRSSRCSACPTPARTTRWQRAALRRRDAEGARRLERASAPAKGEPPLGIGIGLNYGPGGAWATSAPSTASPSP